MRSRTLPHVSGLAGRGEHGRLNVVGRFACGFGPCGGGERGLGLPRELRLALGLSVPELFLARQHGVGHDRRYGGDGTNGVVVAWNHIVHGVRIAVGVNDGDDWNIQLAGFGDGVGFALGINDEECGRQPRHVLDAAHFLGDAGQFNPQALTFLLGERVELAGGLAGFKLPQALQTCAQRLEISERAAEPAVLDIVGATAFRLLTHDFLGLALGSNKNDLAAAGGGGAHEGGSSVKRSNGVLKVNDVDAAPRAEDELRHLGVPARRSVAKVHTRGE